MRLILFRFFQGLLMDFDLPWILIDFNGDLTRWRAVNGGTQKLGGSILGESCEMVVWWYSYLWILQHIFHKLSYIYICDWWLVWNIFSPYIGRICPTDFHIFQMGRSTPKQISYVYSYGSMATSWEGTANPPSHHSPNTFQEATWIHRIHIGYGILPW
jgi:hypothetical protein